MKEQPIETYMHQEQDLDYNYYWFTNRDVELYGWLGKGSDKEITAIFERFEKRSEQWLYIKGNYFFFTLKGAKYWTILTHSEWEWNHIQELIKEIEPLIEGYYYYRGCLD